MVSSFSLLGGGVPASASLLPNTRPKGSAASATLPQHSPSDSRLAQQRAEGLADVHPFGALGV